MDDRELNKLQSWIERKYREKASVQICLKHSILLSSSYTAIDGLNIHTDGVIENNSKDGFDKIIVSGFNYLMLCLYGKEFSNIEDARIIVYCNANSKFTYRKYKNAIRGVLNKY